MITIQISDKHLLDQKVDGHIIFLEQDFKFSKLLKEIADSYFPHLEQFFKKHEFNGKLNQTLVLPIEDDSVSYISFIGLGKKDKHIDIENYRRALGKAIKQAVGYKCDSIAIEQPAASLFKVDTKEIAKQTALIADMAAYNFTEFKGEKHKKEKELTVTVCVDAKQKTVTRAGIKDGEVVAQSVNLARTWIDTPPSDLTPTELAGKAKKIAKEFKLKYTEFSEAQIIKMGMGGLAAVSRASDQDCKLAILEYHKKKGAPTLALVGKGITFDSGGLSIKPASGMETMKEDMSGAAAVIATMRAIAQLKPNINVIGLTPLAENLPSGKATKPGDVAKFYNGVTAEIKNTDAEGRLILGDALAYAVKHYKPDAMIDIATLTGACAYALGPFYTGLMSNYDDLVKRIEKAAQDTGDRVWRLPFSDDYEPAIKSNIADISNIGSRTYMAGAITAGRFLQHFVGDTKWAHLDIAGTAFNVPDMPYYRPGATGAGVRLFVDLIMNWK